MSVYSWQVIQEMKGYVAWRTNSAYISICVNINKRILIVYNAGSKIWEYIEYITKKEKNREIYICIRICIDIPLI